ncbi:MAG: TonB-dependent receptor [Acidobacteriota bacterium]
MTGTVTTAGNPLPGVTVTITSPSLQGTRTAVTGEGGGYSFPSLPPGQYTVTMELEGMQKVTKRAVLALAASSHMDADLKMASIGEAIVVTAAAPAVLETSQVATNFDQKQIQELPVRRNVRDTVLLAPGVTANGPNNQIMLSGAPSYDNLFLVNGVVVNENLRGQPHNLFIEDAIQETTILTGGISAEYGRFTGGVVSTLTKSGGNEFSGSLRDSITNPKWVSTTDYPGGELAHPNVRSNIYEGTLGGYVMKDRVWFFGAGRYSKGAPANGFNSQVTGISGKNGSAPAITFPGLSYLNTLDEKRYEAKLTGNLTQKHTLVASYLDIKLTENNNAFTPIYDAASIVAQRSLPNSLKSLSYNGILTTNLLIEGQVSQKKFAFVNSGGIYTDQIKGTWIQDANARFNAPVFCGVCTPEDRNNDLASAKGHYYLNTKSFGNHELVAGGEKYKETRLVNNNQSASNFTITSTGTANFLPGDPTPYPHFIPGNNTTSIFYRPILQSSTGDHFNTTGIFLNDKWDVNSHWNVNLGLRYDKNNVIDASGNTVSKDSGISPRFAAIWDIRGNGRDRIDARYARYVSKIADGNAGSAGNAAGTPASFQWFYNGPAVNPIDANGVIIGTPVKPQDALTTLFNWFNTQMCDSQNRCGINATGLLAASSYPGYTQKVLGSIKSPNVDEISVGYGHQFGTSAFAKIDLIKRDWHDFYGLMVNQTTGSITAPNGSVSDLAVLVNNDNDVKRNYRAAQAQFSWQRGRINIGGGYTYSKLRGNDIGEADGTATSAQTAASIFYPEYTSYARRQPVGYLTADVTHRAKIHAGIDFPSRFGLFNLSAIQSADSGRPYSAIGTVDPTGTNAGFRYTGAPTIPSYYVGTAANKNVPSQLSTSQNYYFSDRGAFRTPSVFSTDFALNYSFPIGPVALFAQGQVINVFNNSKVSDLVGGRFDTTVRTSRSNGLASGLLPFNPFTATPIECPASLKAQQCTDMGANWQKGPAFGTGLNKDAYQTPRTYRVALGLRF